MTFKQFQATVNHFRNDIVVSKHGDYCNNKSNNTLGITYLKDGKESRVYDYHGTYEQVLSSLGITEYYTTQDITNYEMKIKSLERWHGTKEFFADNIIDNTAEIKNVKKEMQYRTTLYKAC